MNKRLQTILSFLGIIGVLCTSFSLYPQMVKAAFTQEAFLTNKMYNNLISERDFTDVNSMSAAEVQAFLVAKNSGLKDFSEGGRTAAQIIYDAAKGKKFTAAVADGDWSTPLGESFKGAKAYEGVTLNEATGTISPKVILVMLQKEQSLITETTLDVAAAQIAVGYGCPDSGGCSAHYKGFTNQVEWAAWQLRYNFERAKGKGADFQVGEVLKNVDGKYDVTFTNAATASLYRYTPHVFDSAYNFMKLFDSYFTQTADTEANDTTNITIKTYAADQKFSGVKNSTVTAYVNGSAIDGGNTGSRSWALTLSNMTPGNNVYTITYKDAAGTLVGTKIITVEVHKQGDINGDGAVDITDLSIFASYWNQVNPEDPLANLTGQVGHAIDIQDLSILAGYWAK